MNDPSQTPPAADAPMQFEHAELTDDAAASACAVCKQQLRGSYFDVNGVVVCPTCKESILASVQGGSGFARFMKAGLLGTGAAVVGALGYWAVSAATGYNLGLIAVAVGWLVGTAVSKGANGRGGWVYQVLAVLLTYLSIGVSLIPEVLKSSEANSDGATRIVFAIVVAFTGPVIIGVGSPISGLIYGFGLWEAGRRNTKPVISVNGPFQVKAPAAEQPEAAPQPALADASNS